MTGWDNHFKNFIWNLLKWCPTRND
jgi:hypothetical protein